MAHIPEINAADPQEKREPSLLIECVDNGWIVRPFAPCRDWVCQGSTPVKRIWVFTDLRALTEALTTILAVPVCLRSKPPANFIPNEPL